MQKNTDHWIGEVYGAKDRASLEKLYDQWAESYDADLVQTGYLHGAVIAGLMAAHVPHRNAAVLDAGVGTGSVGGILSILGYNNLTGIDMSEGMLAKARERRCYIDLRKAVLGETLPFPDGAFDAIYSTGTFTTGHAPASALDELVRIMEPGGILMVTIGTVVFEEAGFNTKLDTLMRNGKLKPIETTPIYRPMPHSPTESGFTTRAHVFRKS